jgi:hypothetical protein
VKRLLTIFATVSLVCACGEPGAVVDGAEGGFDLPGNKASRTAALTISPTITVNGTEDVFEALDVTRISFDAELFLIPVGLDGVAGDAVDVHFNFVDGEEETFVSGEDLLLQQEGRYRVLLRVQRSTDGISVDIGGSVTDHNFAGLYKAEPAPTAAREKDDAEPAPTAAREKEDCEPAPTAADDNDDEDSEDDCEPAPTAADDNDEEGDTYEPAPTAARSGDNDEDPPSAEPAPTPAEPAPTAARGKGDTEFDPGDTEGAAHRLTVTSREEFEFYAGEVDIASGSTELVVSWDVTSWLRRVMARPLGLESSDLEEAEMLQGDEPGFDERDGDFNLMCR